MINWILKTKQTLKSKKGFTLIELIVVIAILGILAWIAIPRLSGVGDSTNDGILTSQLSTIKGAVQVMLDDPRTAFGVNIRSGNPTFEREVPVPPSGAFTTTRYYALNATIAAGEVANAAAITNGLEYAANNVKYNSTTAFAAAPADCTLSYLFNKTITTTAAAGNSTATLALNGISPVGENGIAAIFSGDTKQYTDFLFYNLKLSTTRLFDERNKATPTTALTKTAFSDKDLITAIFGENGNQIYFPGTASSTQRIYKVELKDKTAVASIKNVTNSIMSSKTTKLFAVREALGASEAKTYLKSWAAVKVGAALSVADAALLDEAVDTILANLHQGDVFYIPGDSATTVYKKNTDNVRYQWFGFSVETNTN